MSTRSTARNIFPPLDNIELTIQRRSRSDPTLLNNSEMAAEGNGDLPVPDLQTMKELCLPSLNGQGGPIAPIAIQATNFGLKNDMIQQVQISCQFHCLPGDDANKHLDKFLHVTQSIKVNGVIDDALHLYLFPYSLTHPAIAWFDHLPRNSINTFEQMAKMFLGKYFPPSMVTKLINEITNFRQCLDESLFEAWEHYKLSIDRFPNYNMLLVTQIDTHPKECYDLIENMTAHHNDWDTSAQRSNIITNPKEDLKGITTRNGTAYQGPTIPTTPSSLPSVVERETETTKDTVHPANNESTKDVQPPVVPAEYLILTSKPVIYPIIEPVASPNKLSLPDLSPTCMTLELAGHSISRPVGVLKDVFVKVGTFHFSADFIVVDFDADPQIPLILGRYFLKTVRDLIDVFKGELTLRVDKEAITFNLNQSSRYSANYNDMMANRINVIDMACEEYSQEVLGFFDVIAIDAFLALEDDPTSPEVDQSYLDTEGEILLLEAFMDDDPSLPPPNQGNHMPQVRKELKICKAKIEKSSIDEPPEVELKDLPPHLEYTFLEGDEKLPVIIVKDLSMEEKTALITVLKSQKRAIAWKLFNINGIDPEFCTHKILLEEDFEPAVQHQRRVNLKIHNVNKQEVLKLLDAGLIYPISDSP
nr:reverse transcriptase domain-containing protein [Tanacetum cinerariifolium]